MHCASERNAIFSEYAGEQSATARQSGCADHRAFDVNYLQSVLEVIGWPVTHYHQRTLRREMPGYSWPVTGK
jgi:hypothetical protein